MTAYKILSLINATGCISGIVLMVIILIKYEIPRKWQIYMFLVFVLTLLIMIGQIWAFVYMPKTYWILKMWAMLYWIKIFVFCRAITTVSMIKKNFYK